MSQTKFCMSTFTSAPFNASRLKHSLLTSKSQFNTHKIHTNGGVATSLSRRDILLATTTTTTVASLGINQPSKSDNTSSVGNIQTASSTSPPSWELEFDQKGKQRLKLQDQGYNTWQWRSHKINWLSAGQENKDGPIILLIHGFGASVYHYRYMIPQLSKTCRVYAVDCLGFGWSEKALVDYDGYKVWSDQISDFIQQVIHKETQTSEKVVLVGNSLGGYNSMATAAYHPESVKGVVLLNAAGRFESRSDEAAALQSDSEEIIPENSIQKSSAQNTTDSSPNNTNNPFQSAIEAIATSFKRIIVSASFIFTKQPARVRQVLSQVYADPSNIDDELVKSILLPADDPNASEVFYRVITGKGAPVNELLDRMNNMPLFLLWGKFDPWCVPARADQIQNYYPAADRVDVEGGHCVHDEIPDVASEELLKWIRNTKFDA